MSRKIRSTIGLAAAIIAGACSSIATPDQPEILWDEWGVPHIYAANVEDLGYAYGWAQMHNHANAVLQLYGTARGRAAEYWGENYVASDRFIRTIGIPEAGAAAYAAETGEFRRYLDAFVAGMNAYVREHPDRVADPLERVVPVQGGDPFRAGFRAVFTFLSQLGNRGSLTGGLGGMGSYGGTGEMGVNVAAGTAASGGPGGIGSNGWAIAPDRSASGSAMLLQNPHLPWHVPMMHWFEAQVVTPEMNLTGVTLLGLPVIAIGFNENLGWTHTNNTIDAFDTYRLTLTNDGGYVFDGEARAFRVERDTLLVRRDDGSTRAVPIAIRSSVHGPVVRATDSTAIAVRGPVILAGSDSADPARSAGEDLAESDNRTGGAPADPDHEPGDAASSVRGTGAGSVAGSFRQWWELGRARNLEEFRAALERLAIPMFNVIYADRDGNILYLFNGRIPERLRGDFVYWQGTVPGDTSATLWTSVHEIDELPTVVNPGTGFVQNSNSGPWFATVPSPLDPAAHPPYMAPEGVNFREQSGIRLLRSDSSITFDELVNMRYSNRMLLADRMLDDLLPAARASDDPVTRRAAEVLADWDREADARSRGGVLFSFWVRELELWVGMPGEAPAFAVPWSDDAPVSTPDGLEDPAAAARVFGQVARAVERRFGRLDVAWGDVNRLLGGDYNLPGNGAPGGLGVFHVVSYAPNDEGIFRAVHGDSWVATIEFTPEGPRARALLSYGNATQPDSEHAWDQLELLADQEMRPLWRERAEVEAHLERRETLTRDGTL